MTDDQTHALSFITNAEYRQLAGIHESNLCFNGLNCVSACSNCHGTDCCNALSSRQDSNIDVEQDENLDVTDADALHFNG